MIYFHGLLCIIGLTPVFLEVTVATDELLVEVAAVLLVEVVAVLLLSKFNLLLGDLSCFFSGFFNIS